ncbi:hypothetical protein [Xanthomonas hortorum]|uniref:hypothetical protein n=1 Tax=Xanthomonas hortorum TaxID=56454 RepID=UPI001F3CE0BF|nr:hypothetical protein [Xanthomonas hortorum]MCE4297238.1 hypothetical protein [Xanthomonas hortorum pv. vitians]MCE4366214.1 hypothetical protein [Xanthomonas hortorum pv. vitians]
MDDEAQTKHTEEHPALSSWKRWWGSIHWRVYCLFPRIIGCPYDRSALREAEHDAKQNQDSYVPPESKLRCDMVWGVELYGPDEIEQLYGGLKKLGWRSVASSHADNFAHQRVRQMRIRDSSGWINIGVVMPPGRNRHFMPIDNHAKLPESVESLVVRVYQVTPSLTAVAIAFRLNEAAARKYEERLNASLRTIHRRLKGTWQIEHWGPVNQKQEAVRDVREALRSMVKTWFSNHIPGYFCGTHSAMPTMELVVGRGLCSTEGGKRMQTGWRSWQALVAESRSRDNWVSDKYPGLELAFYEDYEVDFGIHLLLRADPDYFTKDVALGTDLTNGSCGSFWDDTFNETLVHCATIELLRSQTRLVRAVRERMKLVRTGRSHVSRTLSEIGSFFDQTLGSPSVLRELRALSKDVHSYQQSCANLTAPPWYASDSPNELHQAIRRTVRDHSKQLIVEEADLRGHVGQLASILSVRESIAVQRWMLGLAIVALIVAVGSLVATLPRDVVFYLKDSALTQLQSLGAVIFNAMRLLLAPT